MGLEKTMSGRVIASEMTAMKTIVWVATLPACSLLPVPMHLDIAAPPPVPNPVARAITIKPLSLPTFSLALV